jgi:ribosomal protein S7
MKFSLLKYFKSFFQEKYAYWKTENIPILRSFTKKPSDSFNCFFFFNLINGLTNNLLRIGKKKTAIRIVQKLFLMLKFKLKKHLNIFLSRALKNIRPLFIFKSMYIGGKKYSIPIMLPEYKSFRLAIK